MTNHLLILFSLLLTLLCAQEYCIDRNNISVTHIDLGSNVKYVFQVDQNISLMLTQKGKVFRTVDSGREWLDISDKLEDFDTTDQGATQSYSVGDGALRYWLHGRIIYLKGAGWKLWVSTDDGETFTLYYTDTVKDIYYIQGHRTQPTWVLALSYVWGYCCNGVSCYCASYASISKDNGATWDVKYGSDIESVFDWTAPGYVVDWAGAGIYSPDESFLVIGWENGRGYDWTKTKLFYIENGVKTALGQNDFVDGAGAIVYIPEQNSMLVGVYPNFVDFEIYVTNFNPTMDFIPEIFSHPNGDSGEIYSLHFLDVDVGSTFIGVNRNSHGSYVEDVFVADLFHGGFTLSLDNCVADLPNRVVDFAKVAGIDGVYLANQWVDNEKVSRISFDDGALWYPLVITTDNCTNCSLNIHGPTTNDNEFFSRSSVKGTILANGNIGDYISTENVGVYISRDGGRDWEFLVDGEWKLGILNRGSIIVFFSKDPTFNLTYTADLGLNWTTCNFHKNEIDDLISNELLVVLTAENDDIPLLNIISKTTLNVSGTAETKYLLWTVDFTGMLPECTDDDFELFTPHGEFDDCILGKRLQYLRLKKESVCHISRDIDEEISTEYCNCTRQDYVCSFCFDLIDDECVLSSLCDLSEVSPPPADCEYGQTYEGISRFRKVAGSQCINEIEEFYLPEEFPCPEPVTTTELEPETTSTISSTISSTSSTSPTSSDNIETDDININDFIDQPVLAITLVVFVVILAVLFIFTIAIYHHISEKELVE